MGVEPEERLRGDLRVDPVGANADLTQQLIGRIRRVVRLIGDALIEDRRPIEEDCPCPACRHSRSYLRHLFLAGEMLGPILVSLHNLTMYARLMRRLRDAVLAGRLGVVAEQLRGPIEGEAD